jgi:hypothetical protein
MLIVAVSMKRMPVFTYFVEDIHIITGARYRDANLCDCSEVARNSKLR